MKLIKWVVVVLLCALLGASAAAGSFFVAVDRTIGSTEFLSSFIQSQKLGEIGMAAQNAAQGNPAASGLAYVGKLGYGILEPEIKRQSKSMLDQIFAYLKGKKDKPTLTMNLSDFKQDPAVLNSTVSNMMQNETVKNLPRSLVEPAAKMLMQKVPNELNLTSLVASRESDLAQAREYVGKFYTAYSTVFVVALVLVIFIAFALRNLRQTLVAVGVTLLITSAILFLPWFASGSIAQSVVSGYKGVAAASVQAIGSGFIKSFFAVFVISPVVLLIAGGVAFVGGWYLAKNPAR